MKSLYEYIIYEEGEATPAGTMGTGEPSISGEVLSEPIRAVDGGMPRERTKIRRKKKKFPTRK